jgi:hypothetical protein
MTPPIGCQAGREGEVRNCLAAERPAPADTIIPQKAETTMDDARNPQKYRHMSYGIC